MYSPKGGTHNKLYTPLTLHCDRIYGFILTQHLYTADANTLHTQMHHAQVDYGRPGNYQNNNGKHKMLVFQHFCIRLQKVIFIPYWGGAGVTKLKITKPNLALCLYEAMLTALASQNTKLYVALCLHEANCHSATITKLRTALYANTKVFSRLYTRNLNTLLRPISSLTRGFLDIPLH